MEHAMSEERRGWSSLEQCVGCSKIARTWSNGDWTEIPKGWIVAFLGDDYVKYACCWECAERHDNQEGFSQ
jgi:hypothetical protein